MSGTEIVEQLFGLDPRQYQEMQEPQRPKYRRGLWAWFWGTNERNLERYHRDHMKWHIERRSSSN